MNKKGILYIFLSIIVLGGGFYYYNFYSNSLTNNKNKIENNEKTISKEDIEKIKKDIKKYNIKLYKGVSLEEVYRDLDGKGIILKIIEGQGIKKDKKGRLYVNDYSGRLLKEVRINALLSGAYKRLLENKDYR